MSGVQRAAIVGGGRMGLGIAESFLLAGLDVTIVETTPELGRASAERLRERLLAHADAGLIPTEAVAYAASARIADTIPEALDGAEVVVEAVTEDVEVKRGVLGECDRAAAPDAILATNTSSLDVELLSGFVERRDRFLGIHWFNPAEWTPGVEVIPCAHTEPGTVERAIELLRATGKRPSVVSGTTGFIANRLQMALFCEAARCVEDGIASPQDIDEVVRSCFGFRLPFFGPFQIADMAGLDVYAAVLEQHRSGLGDRFEVPQLIRDLVDDGHRGTASGRGFYSYADGASTSLLLERDRRYAALIELLREAPPLEFADVPAVT
jgi:3-hydroxybutyryl-CoA dehydrogenase